MGERSLLATRSLSVSSTCTVFAESEVVSLIASGAAPEEIAYRLRAEPQPAPNRRAVFRTGLLTEPP
jgi:hypothetical protein